MLYERIILVLFWNICDSLNPYSNGIYSMRAPAGALPENVDLS